MPQGKGTYGSKVGRPSKKKYDKGGSVDPFSLRNPEGVPAKQAMEALENVSMANESMPTVNAQERSQVSPDVTEYKEGGKVNIADVVKSVEKAMKFEEKAEESEKPIWTKKKKIHRRKARKQAREIIEQSKGQA